MLEILNQIGLSDKKAKIYLACLELGQTNIIDVTRKTGIKRTTVYENLNEMVKEGYIKITTKGRRKIFVALEPQELKDLIRKRESLLEQIMSELIAINNVSSIKPKVWFYEGKEGILEAYYDILNYPGIEVVGWASGEVLKMFNWKDVEKYVAKRQRRKIMELLIMPNDKEGQPFIESAKHQLRNIRTVSADEYPFKIEINVYSNRVGLFSIRDKMAVIIESEPISTAMRMIFKMCWKGINY